MHLTTIMSHSTMSHLITSQTTMKVLTTLLHSQYTNQSQSTKSHQCTMSHIMSTTLTQTHTMSHREYTHHTAHLFMEKHLTAVKIAKFTSQCETTNMSSHTDQKRRTTLLLSTEDITINLTVYPSRFRSIIMLMQLPTSEAMTTM